MGTGILEKGTGISEFGTEENEKTPVPKQDLFFCQVFDWIYWLPVFSHLEIDVASFYAVVFGRLADIT